MLKRARDIAVALLALGLSAPFLLVAILGIRVSSPGPVLYRSERIGLNGVPFDMFKLRTMHVGHPGSFLAAPGDARVFTWGAVLRRTRLDELPQFLNVLNGQMTLVGPRPRVRAVVDGYYTDQMRASLCVRPGLTSPGTLYQVTLEKSDSQGLRDEATYGRYLLPRKVAIDLAYFQKAGFLDDLGVLALTGWFLVLRMSGRSATFPARYRAQEDGAADLSSGDRN